MVLNGLLFDSSSLEVEKKIRKLLHVQGFGDLVSFFSFPFLLTLDRISGLQAFVRSLLHSFKPIPDTWVGRWGILEAGNGFLSIGQLRTLGTAVTTPGRTLQLKSVSTQLT